MAKDAHNPGNMLFLYCSNTILLYKMAAARQETYGNKLAPYVVYCKYKTMNTIISDTHHANISTVYQHL